MHALYIGIDSIFSTKSSVTINGSRSTSPVNAKPTEGRRV